MTRITQTIKDTNKIIQKPSSNYIVRIICVIAVSAILLGANI